LRLVREESIPINVLETIHTCIPNEVYQQIVKDVARSGSHIPQNATEEETENFQEQLTQLMCWVLHKHTQLKLVSLSTVEIIIIFIHNIRDKLVFYYNTK